MFKLTSEEQLSISNGTCSEDLLERAIGYTMDNNEMPYGIQKARAGDPYEWANNWLITNFNEGTQNGF